MGDLVKQRPQQPAAGRQHHPDRQHAAHDRQRHLAQLEVPARRRQRRGKSQERDECQVLEEQHAEGQSTVGAIEFGILGQLLQDDRRRAHRQSAADHDRSEPGKPGELADDGKHGGSHHHLRRAQAEHLAPHRDHPGKRELQAQSE